MAKTGVVDTLYKDCIAPYLTGKSGSGASFDGDGANIPGAPPTAGSRINEVQFDEIKGSSSIKSGKIPGSTKID